jgi:hypothetical protein
MNCNTTEQIEEKKDKYYPQMLQSDINKLEKFNDHEQYPAAQCAMNSEVRMYMRSSSQMVEAMNSANKRMRIDLVNATILLLKMEAERYEKQKGYAESCNGTLTPKGSDL